MNLGNIGRLKVRAVNRVIGKDGVFIELANPIVFKIRAEIFKGFGLTADTGEKLYQANGLADFKTASSVE